MGWTLEHALGVALLLTATLGAVYRLLLGAYRLAKRVETTFHIVSKELTPNGGGSLVDRVKRGEARLQKIETVLEIDGEPLV